MKKISLAKLAAENPDLRGTILVEVLEVMEVGRFIEPEYKKQKDDGRKVGTMNTFEKALWTIGQRLGQAGKTLNKRMDTNERRMRKSRNKRALKAELKKLLSESNCLKANMEAVYALLFQNIVRRFKHNDVAEESGYSVRKGYKIVRTLWPICPNCGWRHNPEEN